MLTESLSEIPYANYFIIIIYYEVFLYFFPNQFFQQIVFFASWRKKISQEAFSERCSLISVVL